MTDASQKAIADAIRLIAHGTGTGPTGLEMLSMAIAGEGCNNPLAETILRGLDGIAEAIRDGLGEIADRIGEPRDTSGDRHEGPAYSRSAPPAPPART